MVLVTIGRAGLESLEHNCIAYQRAPTQLLKKGWLNASFGVILLAGSTIKHFSSKSTNEMSIFSSLVAPSAPSTDEVCPFGSSLERMSLVGF
jgi:hypothetical protein